MDLIGVYQIELNNKIYVGSTTVGFKERWKNHLYLLRRGKHHNPYLQYSFNKYGEDSLNFSIMEVVDSPEECYRLEQKYIDEINPEYNVAQVVRNVYVDKEKWRITRFGEKGEEINKALRQASINAKRERTPEEKRDAKRESARKNRQRKREGYWQKKEQGGQ